MAGVVVIRTVGRGFNPICPVRNAGNCSIKKELEDVDLEQSIDEPMIKGQHM